MAETKNTKAFYNTEIPCDWEVKALCEISKNRNSSLSINALEDNFGDYLLYGASGIIKSINFFEEKEEYISIVKDGAGVGRVFLCEKNSSVLGTMAYIKPLNKNCNLEYLYFLFQSIDYSKYITGSTIPHIYFSSYSAKKIPLPPLPEQTAIAHVLSTADAAIQTTEKLIAQKEQRKKWLMQQLLTGKKRLKGFSWEWEDIELGELLDYEQPTKYLVKDTLYDDSYSTPVLTAGKTFILGYTNENDGICKDLPVIIFDDFTTASKFIDFPFKAKSSAMKLLRPKQNVNLKFVYEAMQLINYTVGGHERHWISKFVYLTIPCPPLEEQTAIAEVLQTADKEINLLKTKATKLREQKKGLMQQLLTGKVRLKLNN